MFKIKLISVSCHDSSYGGYPYKIFVSVDVDANHWKRFRRNNQLGMLYGIDISNEVFKLSKGLVPAYNPTVSDRKRAKNGFKNIELVYYFRDHSLAEKLGLEVIRLKNGEAFPKFNTYSTLYKESI